LKRKGSNIKIKSKPKTKGLIFLILLFFSWNCFAQKIIKKSIKTDVSSLIIEFNSIDQLDLVCSNSKNEVVVISQNERNQSPTVNLQEINGVLFIKSFEKPTQEDMVEIDKLCTIQPMYTSFKISIPKNKNVQVIYTQGNFLTENFEGNLKLKLEEGIVKIGKYTGNIAITLYNGQVVCNAIQNTELNINSNIGNITTNFELDNGGQNAHEINGVFGQKLSSLTIESILANMELTTNKN
jgi:hypothetical protein